MDVSTKGLANHVKSKGITITAVSQNTGIPYDALWASFSKDRDLRADEFLLVCKFLEVNPMTFFPTSQPQPQQTGA